MAEKARKSGVILRPHFKTHQSHGIGQWFRAEGTKAITVSSLSMAKYFAQDSWDDILVAFPVNILEIDTINELAGRITISLLLESPAMVRLLDSNLKSAVSVYIKVDTGHGRTGVKWNDYVSFNAILDSIRESSKISFTGFLTHAGNSYSARSGEEAARAGTESISRMVELKGRYAGSYPGLLISTGDTPSCSIIDDFSMVDELRPGNYVFYDFTQYKIGSCRQEDIAVAVACPVVAVHSDRNEAIIYGGAVHFSKDSIKIGDETFYGPVVRNAGDGWSEIIEGAWLKKMSQEHGIVTLPPEMADYYKPGDIITILPVHSCLTANQSVEYLTLTGKRISHFRSL
jgi:D-serine deaminase-like pyridoxal phosphate-dependent protein